MKFKGHALSFDDILLLPHKSNIKTRANVDLTMSAHGLYMGLPIFSAPMDTVTGGKMAEAMAMNGGLGIIHRYNSIEDQVLEVKCAKLNEPNTAVGAAIGANGDSLERAHALCEAGANLICVDVAHGHHELVAKTVSYLRETFPDLGVMAGNVATAKGFRFLESAGAQFIRVGIGGGSCCSTRQKTGHGMPLLESIMRIADERPIAAIVADGGIRNSGDIAKAIAAGSTFVMVGSLLAGTDETPGLSANGKKRFRGMASAIAQEEWRGQVSVVEGVSTMVDVKGNVKSVLDELANGLRSACSYSGVDKLSELSSVAEYVTQSASGIIESSPHILENK